MRLRYEDPETGLKALCALGTGAPPALAPSGVVRTGWEKEVNRDLTVAVRDLSVRTGALGLDLGVAALRVFAVPTEISRQEALGALARALEWLEGRVLAIPGPHLSPEELEALLEITDHVAGLPVEQGGSGDPSPWTALGALSAIRACVPDLEGAHVAILGVGRVGSTLATLLAEEGAKLTVADLDSKKTRAVAIETGAQVVDPDEILGIGCDVLSPNGRGVVFNEKTVPGLACRAIAGSANGQVKDEQCGEMIRDRGIPMVPEQVAGTGWLLNLATELVEGGYKTELARVRVVRIEDAAGEVLRIAAEEGVTGFKAAELLGDRWRASG